MQSLENLIQAAKENDEGAMLKIIEKFQPIITKYFKMSYYNEDVKSTLHLKLIEIVKVEINFSNMQNNNEGALVNYIASSLHHHYITASAKNDKYKSEIGCEGEALIDLFDANRLYSDEKIEDNLLFETLKDILTEREFECIYYIVFMGHTAEELSKKWNITKQACNQCKKRAFKKALKYFIK
jgi:hypothetical protein